MSLDLSICIVTLRARDYLRACLQSLAGYPPRASYEIIIVDQNSADGTVEMLRAEFPQARLLHTPSNQGFVRPMNLAMRSAQGRHKLLLNPDTLVPAGAIDLLLAYLESNPRAGIVSPKVLNPDGSLQKPCRRGDARPWAVISYFTGLSRLFPKKAFFNGYLLTHLDENQTHAVDGVSGSCMLVRDAVIEQIGYFDERYFAYQEDADYCLQARRAGWQVIYYPAAQITHFGGQGGSRAQPYRSIWEWHRSYFLYYRKNFAADYFFLFNGVYYLAMGLKLLLALARNALSRRTFAGTRKPG